MVTSVGKCLAEGNLSIFHSITAENARSTSEKKARGEELGCNKRVGTNEYRSGAKKAKSGDWAGGAKLTLLRQGPIFTEGGKAVGNLHADREWTETGKSRWDRIQRETFEFVFYLFEKLFLEYKRLCRNSGNSTWILITGIYSISGFGSWVTAPTGYWWKATADTHVMPTASSLQWPSHWISKTDVLF